MVGNKVYIVDDDPYNLELLSSSLRTLYNVDCASSGDECLKNIEKIAPDLVLLDIVMPGIDGYETCQKLKEDPATKMIPVIFVSSHDSLEERLKGYEVGGEDYIVKPVSTEELKRKIALNISNKSNIEDLKKEVDDAMKTVVSVATSSGEMAGILGFMREILTHTNFDQVLQSMLDTASSFGLSSAVQLRVEGGDLTLNNAGIEHPLEKSLISELKGEGSIFDFGCRTLFNYGRASLLIKNMPLDDSDLYGRHKDNLHLLVSGASARAIAIEAQNKLKKQQALLSASVEKAKEAMQKSESENALCRNKTATAMENLLEEIEASFMHLGMEGAQESALLRMITNAFNTVMDLQSDSMKDDKHLEEMIELLTSAIKYNEDNLNEDEEPEKESTSSVNFF